MKKKDDEIVRGNENIENVLGRRFTDLYELRALFGFPLESDDGGWMVRKGEVERWLKSWGLSEWQEVTRQRLETIHARRQLEALPETVLTGWGEIRNGAGRSDCTYWLRDYPDACPITKNEAGEPVVTLRALRLFMADKRLRMDPYYHPASTTAPAPRWF